MMSNGGNGMPVASAALTRLRKQVAAAIGMLLLICTHSILRSVDAENKSTTPASLMLTLSM